MKLRPFLSGAALAFALLPAVASAATFKGEFWDATASIANMGQADDVISAGAATATFLSTGIDYPQGSQDSISDSTHLVDYLGADGASLSGAQTATLGQSVFRFTGFLNLLAGVQKFAVGSDDGFRLSIGGNVISSFQGGRAFGTTTVMTDAGEGRTAFELIYYENGGDTGVRFRIDDVLAQPAADINEANTVAAVPLPAGLPLVLIGLGALGLVSRKRAAA